MVVFIDVRIVFAEKQVLIITCLWSFYLDFHSPCKAASLLPVSISVTVNSIDLFQNGGHDY